MSSLKVKRLKQETVGNKQEEVETNLEEESFSSKPAASLGRVGEGLPSLPLAAGPLHP